MLDPTTSFEAQLCQAFSWRRPGRPSLMRSPFRKAGQVWQFSISEIVPASLGPVSFFSQRIYSQEQYLASQRVLEISSLLSLFKSIYYQTSNYFKFSMNIPQLSLFLGWAQRGQCWWLRCHSSLFTGRGKFLLTIWSIVQQFFWNFCCCNDGLWMKRLVLCRLLPSLVLLLLSRALAGVAIGTFLNSF